MKLILLAVVAVVLALPARAEDAAKPSPAKSSWSDFLKNIRSSLGQSAVSGERKKARNATSVAAVRGKKQKNMADLNEPSIMGDKGSQKAKVEDKNDAELDAAVAVVQKGDLDKGLAALQEFKAAHPKHRTEDVDKLIEGIKAQQAEKGNAAPAAKE